MGRGYPRRLSREKLERRPWEFKKKLAAWAAVVATAAAVASYVLAALGKETAGDVTITASTSEKVSRNRHGLDADGNPIENNMEE